METKQLGNKVQSFSISSGRSLFRKLKYISPSIIAIIILIIILIEEMRFPGSVFHETWEMALMAVILLPAIGWLLWVIKKIRFYHEIAVHENGFEMHFGSEVVPMYYDDLEGMSVLRTHTTYSGMIPVSRTHKMTIVPKDGKEFEFTGGRSPQIKNLAPALNDYYTAHATKSLSREQIQTAQITFGKNLELKDGHFHAKVGLLRTTDEQIPLNQVRSIQDNSGKITLDGPYAMSRKGGAIDIPTEGLINEGILWHVVNNA